MATTAPPVWNRWELLAAPAFATLAPLIEQLQEDHFPTLAQLNRMCDERRIGRDHRSDHRFLHVHRSERGAQPGL